MKTRKHIVFVVKLLVLAFSLSASIVLIYHAPQVPSFLKPFLPIKARWTDKELVDQINSGNVDRDFLTYFNRDPERTVPKEKNIIVSPADGTVKVIRDVNGRRRVVIYMSLWDVHIQRVPLGGKIMDVIDSQHEDQDDFKCANCFEKITEIDADIGRITVKQVTSVLAKRISLRVRKGEQVSIGDRLGAILLGSHTVLEMPPSANVSVKKGEKVYGGETIIASY